jgi:PPOX class probable F420-dependent enzyme
VDAKPKRVPAAKLKRLRNIAANPQVSVVVDHYEEDWTQLAYVLLHGSARVVAGGDEHARALRLLRKKYPQYRAMPLEGAPVICIKIERVVDWGSLDRALRQG